MTKSFTGRRIINEKKYKTKKSRNDSENTTEEMKKILEDSQSDINVSRQQMGMNTMHQNMMQPQMPNMNMGMNIGMNMMQPQMPNMNMGMTMMQPQMPMTSAGEIDPLMVNTLAPVNMNQNSMMHQQQLLSGAQMAQNVNVMSEQQPMMQQQMPMNMMQQQMPMNMMQQQMPMNMMQQQMPMMGRESLNINAIKNLSGLNTMKMI